MNSFYIRDKVMFVAQEIDGLLTCQDEKKDIRKVHLRGQDASVLQRKGILCLITIYS